MVRGRSDDGQVVRWRSGEVKSQILLNILRSWLWVCNSGFWVGLDIFSCEAQLNKCTFVSVCLSVCLSVCGQNWISQCLVSLWQLMTTYDSLWQLMTAYDSLWQLMTAYDSLWQLLTTSDNFWQLMTTYDSFWQILTTSDNFWQLLTTFDKFWQLTTSFDILTAYDSFCMLWHK